MSTKYNQAGIGLVEVMVAVLLLAIAVLGFSALQMRAIQATDESLMRTQAMSVVRGLSESMRANSGQLPTYQDVINNEATANDCSSMSQKCTAAQIATNEALAAKNAAKTYGVKLGIAECPGTSGFAEVKCVIAAWNDTKAEFSAHDKACASATGVYNTKASCVIVEAY